MRYKFRGTYRDGAGNVVPGGMVSVYESGTTTAASIYETVSGTTVVNSTTTGLDGAFEFYIAEGDYYGDHTRKLVLSKSGLSTKTYDYVSPSDFYNGAFTDATIATALTGIGTDTEATVALRPGTWVFDENIDWSAYTNITLKLMPGAVIQIADGAKLTIGGPFEAGDYQVFDDKNTDNDGVQFINIRQVKAVWFGVKFVQSGTPADSSNAMNQALNSIPYYNHRPSFGTATFMGGGAQLLLQPGIMLVSETLFYPGGVEIIGAGWGTEIRFTPAASDTLFAPNTNRYSHVTQNYFEDVRFTNIFFRGDLTTAGVGNAAIAIDFTRVGNAVIRNCMFYRWTNATYHSGLWPASYEHCTFIDNLLSVEFTSTSGYGNFIDCRFFFGSDFVASPTNFIKTGADITLTGCDLEPGSTLVSFDACILSTGHGVVNLQGGHIESLLYSFLKISGIGATYGNHVIKPAHAWASPIVEFEKWTAELADVTAEVNETYRSIDMETSASSKILNIFNNKYFLNGIFSPEGYLSRPDEAKWNVSYDTTKTFFNKGSIKLSKNSGASQDYKITIPASVLAPYYGKRLWFGAVMSQLGTFSASNPRLQVAFTTSGRYKRFVYPYVKYGTEWQLYCVDFVPLAGEGDLTLILRTATTDAGAATVWLGGMWLWTQGYNWLQSPEPEIYKMVAAPQGGIWEEGDRVYNSTPAPSGTEGWVVTSVNATTVKTTAAKGDTTIDVTDSTGMAQNDPIWILTDDTGCYYNGKIASVVDGDTITITPGLPYAATAGNAVSWATFKAFGTIAP